MMHSTRGIRATAFTALAIGSIVASDGVRHELRWWRSQW